MVIIPDRIKDEAGMRTFFDGMRAGVLMCDRQKGARVSFKKEAVTAADLIHDLHIFEESALALLDKKKEESCTKS